MERKTVERHVPLASTHSASLPSYHCWELSVLGIALYCLFYYLCLIRGLSERVCVCGWLG